MNATGHYHQEALANLPCHPTTSILSSNEHADAVELSQESKITQPQEAFGRLCVHPSLTFFKCIHCLCQLV